MDDQPDVEILIHIEAPSRAIDDARYRSLATAYLGFEPRRVHSSSQIHHNSGNHGDEHELVIPPSVARDDEFSVMPSGVRLGTFQSPQVSFRSVVDNADSPQMRVGEIIEESFVENTPAVSATQASWNSPPDIVQDSYPMNHTDFISLTTTPTKVLENYLQHFESPLGSQSSEPASYRDISQKADQQPAENPIPCTPQIIPATKTLGQRLSDETGGPNIHSSLRRQSEGPSSERSEDNRVDEEAVFIPSSHPLPPTRADSEPPPKSHQLGLVTNSFTLSRTFSDIGSGSFKAPVTVTFLSSHGFTYESLEILPPEPPTSDRHVEPHTLITQGLRKLARDVNISSRFRPKEQTRDLAPYERGYWLLDCSTWEPQLKHDAWAFLANYIGTGTAGWGVRCKRDHDFQELRAYCFGLVAAHIYYVLWLSSQRKIIFTGSSWIDGGGTEVIIMGSKDKAES